LDNKNQNSKSKSDYFEEKVQNFINHLENNDFIISSKAKNVKYSTPKIGFSIYSEREPSVFDALQASLSLCRYSPNSEDTWKEADDVITILFMENLVTDGEGLIAKNGKLEKKVVELEKEKEILSRKLQKTKDKLEEWETEYGLLNGKHFQGDVES
jgi:hypothetical protein